MSRATLIIFSCLLLATLVSQTLAEPEPEANPDPQYGRGYGGYGGYGGRGWGGRGYGGYGGQRGYGGYGGNYGGYGGRGYGGWGRRW